MREGWRIEKFGGICDLKKGRKPRLTNTKEPNVNPYLVARYLRGAEPTDFAFIADKNSISVTADEIIIICDGSNSGETFIGFDGILSSTMAKIVHGNNIETKFIIYFLELMFEKFNSSKTGSAIPHLDLNALRNQVLPVPPLPEQRRIVAILDEAFEGIAIAKANAEKNLQNTHEVFESHMNAVFSQRGEGWVEKSLGELATLRNGINFSKARSGETIKILGVKDFQYNYWAPIDNFDTIVSDGKIKSSDILKENDIVFVRSNGNPELIGRCLLVGRVNEKVTHSGFTIRARLSSSDVNIQYLCHFLKLRETHRKMIDGGNGISIKSLNQETLSNLIIPLPRLLEKQTKIVNQVEKLSAETQHLEFIYEKKLTALDELKQSLLHQAFNGDL